MENDFSSRSRDKFTPPSDEDDIGALIQRVTASTEEANDALDDVLSFIAESNGRIAAMSRGKE
jgi:hypothetical protein